MGNQCKEQLSLAVMTELINLNMEWNSDWTARTGYNLTSIKVRHVSPFTQDATKTFLPQPNDVSV